jgi:hypothetical protein
MTTKIFEKTQIVPPSSHGGQRCSKHKFFQGQRNSYKETYKRKENSRILHHDGVAQDDESYGCNLLVILLSFSVVGTYENIVMLPPRPFVSLSLELVLECCYCNAE